MSTGSERLLKIAIVGVGEVAQYHIAALQRIKQVELIAICELNSDLANRVAKQFHIGKIYTDFSELLAKEQLDIVHITTPPSTHLALSVKAMNSGCHVVIEKPLALDVIEADKIIESARANNVQICVIHNALFAPVVLRVKSMIDNGIIGDLTGMHIVDTSPREGTLMNNKDHWCHSLPGGIFGEMLPHPLYLAQSFLGTLEPVAVHSQKLGDKSWVNVDEVRIILKGETNIATILESVNTAGGTTAFDLFGTKATLHVDIPSGIVIKNRPRGHSRLSRGTFNIRTGMQWLCGTLAAGFGALFGLSPTGHYTLIRRFIDSLLGDTEPPVPIDEAREIVKLYQTITSQIR